MNGRCGWYGRDLNQDLRDTDAGECHALRRPRDARLSVIGNEETSRFCEVMKSIIYDNRPLIVVGIFSSRNARTSWAFCPCNFAMRQFMADSYDCNGVIQMFPGGTLLGRGEHERNGAPFNN